MAEKKLNQDSPVLQPPRLYTRIISYSRSFICVHGVLPFCDRYRCLVNVPQLPKANRICIVCAMYDVGFLIVHRSSLIVHVQPLSCTPDSGPFPLHFCSTHHLLTHAHFTPFDRRLEVSFNTQVIYG